MSLTYGSMNHKELADVGLLNEEDFCESTALLCSNGDPRLRPNDNTQLGPNADPQPGPSADPQPGPSANPQPGPSHIDDKTPLRLTLTKGLVHPCLDLKYAWIRIEDVPDVGISTILQECNEMVLNIINRRLTIVGWRRVFPVPNKTWHKVVNIVHPITIVLVILLTYIMQGLMCFKRSGATFHYDIPDHLTNGTVINSNCHEQVTVDHIIPDILSAFAYCYSFYVLRGCQCEQIQSLLEKVFLQALTMDSGYMTQKSLRSIRIIRHRCNLWIVLSMLAQILHSVVAFDDIPPASIGLYWAPEFSGTKQDAVDVPGYFDHHHGDAVPWRRLVEERIVIEPVANVGKVIMLVFMLLGFVLFDLVYTTVIINYAVQCTLLVYYARGLKEKILSKNIELQKAIGHVYDIKSTIHLLNRHAALVTSVILLNFSSYAIKGIYGISQGPHLPLTYVESGLAVILWSGMVAFPVIQAMRLTAACNSLKAVGAELRTRPYCYRATPTEELDSFITFLSNTPLQAKLFLCPVRVSFMLPAITAVLFITLLLSQLDVKLYLGVQR